jgi:DNA-directed RNA polymerase specialized sigma24 family protein
MDTVPAPSPLPLPLPQNYIPYVQEVCRARLGPALQHEVMDATSDSLTRAWEKRHLYDPSRGPYRTWLAQVTRNVCATIRRRELTRGLRRQPTGGGDDTYFRERETGSTPPCDVPVLEDERHKIVLHHAETLPPAMSRAVLVRLSGHTHHEAAHKLGVSYAAYHRSLCLGKERITRIIDEEGA